MRPKRAPPPAGDRRPSILIRQKAGAERRMTMPLHALIVHEDVRARAQSRTAASSWQRRTSAASSSGVLGLGKILGRAAQLEPGVHRQRLALPRTIRSKPVQRSHEDSCPSLVASCQWADVQLLELPGRQWAVVSCRSSRTRQLGGSRCGTGTVATLTGCSDRQRVAATVTCAF